MRIWILPCVIAVCLLIPGAVAAQDAQATAAQLERLKRDVSQLQQRISNREKERKDEQQALAEAERSINRVSSELRALDQELQQLNDNMLGLHSQRDALEAALEKRRVLVNQLIQEQYRQGRQPRLELLLKQQDPERLDRMLRYYDYLNAELTLQLSAYQSQLTHLNSTRVSIGSTEDQIAARREKLISDQQQLEKAKRDRQTALTRLGQAQQEEQQRLVGLRRNQQELESLLGEIQRSLETTKLAQDSRQFASLKGRLSWPVEGRLLRTFGSQRSGISFEGLLISAQTGIQVKAIHHGRVVFSDWLRGYGLVLILDHGSGYMSLYGHNQTLLREPGDWVGAGQPIATIGNSGGHEEIGLYFAIRHQGKPVNPSEWLSRP